MNGQKMWYIHIIEYYSGIKKKWTTYTCQNIDEPRNHYAKWQKPATKNHILYDSIYMKYLVRQIYRDQKYIRGCLGLGMRMKNDSHGHKGPL